MADSWVVVQPFGDHVVGEQILEPEIAAHAPHGSLVRVVSGELVEDTVPLIAHAASKGA